MEKGWEYYNHALVPSTPPHADPDTSILENRSVWKAMDSRPSALLARWTTDFDCGKETDWWYIIKDAPFEPDSLEKNARKHIRQALRKCTVRKIQPEDCMNDLFRVYEEAYARYQNADNQVSYEQFRADCLNTEYKIEYWGGYEESGRMIGYVTVIVGEDYAEISTAKFSAQYMNLRVSDALYYTVLEIYLNQEGKQYITSGQRSINHVTNTQEYKMKTFGFRKAYCRLHIRYNPRISWVIVLLYPFRKLLRIFERITFVHQLTSILNMEEIHRSFQ